MLDKPTFDTLRRLAPLGKTLVAGFPDLHWSCPRRYRQHDGIQSLKDLGATAVTVLDFENTCHIQQDLNLTWDWRIPQFDTILDVGTFEHIADPFTCISEYVRHLCVGGRLIIHTVHNQLPEHGYWQPTPRFFWDFLQLNDFKDVEIISYSPFFFRPKKWQPSPEQSWQRHGHARLQTVSAIRHTDSQVIRHPQQSHWSPPSKGSPLRRIIRRVLQQLISDPS